MDMRQFQADLIEVCTKHYTGLLAFVFAVAYQETENGDILGEGNTIIPVPPRDHEEELLRDSTAKKITQLCHDLVKNTYL